MNEKMSDTLKAKWIHLYEVANNIGLFEPWKRFTEDNCFSFIPKGDKDTYIFSFVGESAARCGIACYLCENDYLQGRKRLEAPNTKDEPVFFLQNAYMCLWGNREDISKESYNQIKELGFNFRGKGSWLYFTRFEVGYLPVLLEENEVDTLICAFENLFMMLKAIYENGLDPEFEKGKTLVRWFDKEKNLYYTHPFNIEYSKAKAEKTTVTIEENDLTKSILKMPISKDTLELDWSYIPLVFNDNSGKDVFPFFFLAVCKETGIILHQTIIDTTQNKINIILNSLINIINKNGKPKEIIICDKDIENIISDLCKKIEIKLTVKKALPDLNKTRKMFFPLD